MSRNFIVKGCHKNVRMMSVLIKMAGVNVRYLKVKMDLFKCWHQKYARKRNQHAFVDTLDNSVPRVTALHHRQSLVMPSSDPRDRTAILFTNA